MAPGLKLLLLLFAPSSGVGVSSHLRYMSPYDLPVAECASAHTWVNLLQTQSLTDAVLCKSHGIPAMLDIGKLMWVYSKPGMNGKSCFLVPGGCLRDDWEKNWQKLRADVAPLIANGTVVGFDLGDELLCHSLSLGNLTTVADAVREAFPSVDIWWNECGHTASDTKPWQLPDGTAAGAPASISLFSIDFPYATVKSDPPTWNHSVVTLPTASMMRAYVEQYVYPKLHPHQSVILLVPAFGSRCAAVAKANQEPLPPSVCPTLACNDERAAAIITGYFKWAQEDTRVAAIAPTFYAGCGRNDTVSQSSHVSCFPAVCEKQPVLFWDWLDVGFGDMNAMPTTLKGWQAVGSAIVSGSPKTLKTDDTSTRALPPPVVNATCAAELNAYCDGGCGGRSTCSPPSWKPIAHWICYSHLATKTVNGTHEWDKTHPTGCSCPELQSVYDKCMGVGPPPPPPPPMPTQLKISSVLGSGMVLQRAPARASVWGEAIPGDVVTVSVVSQAEASTPSTAIVKATADAHGRWAVRTVAMDDSGNPYTITISSDRGKPATPIVLTDVLAGEVHVCSGQSNMDFTLGGVFNATNECKAALNPLLRLFKTTRKTSTVPLFELSAPPVPYLNWNVSSPATACGPEWETSLDRSTGFSAACFFYAQELQQKLKVPVGAVDTSWGGTNIENWMSAQAMDACANHTDPGGSEVSAPSLLYNAMIQPLTQMVAASFLWWQGESNAHSVANAEEYSCNQISMIKDLRAKFDATPDLPFIFVQSFPLFGNLSQFQPYGHSAAQTPALQGLSTLRLSQAHSVSLPGVAMACSIDLGDVGCPFTWQHNRAKRQCAHRAALGARAMIYKESELVYRGPEPRGVRVLNTSCTHGGCAPLVGQSTHAGSYWELAIEFDMFGSKGFHRPEAAPISVLSFEIHFAEGGNASSSSYWVPASLLPPWGNFQALDAADTIGISAMATFSTTAVPIAVRYAHGDFPIGIMHNMEGLPVGPFVMPMHVPPPPPPPPPPPTFTGQMYDVFHPGVQPQLFAEGMESCYRIPSLLYVPPAAAEEGSTADAGTLLAVVESKHGHVCGDGVNSTLVMRRSSDLGLTWQKPFFPYLRWANLRKWGQPQMTYDAVTRTAFLQFSNETISKSPGGSQNLFSVLQIKSTDSGLSWTPPDKAQRVTAADPGFPSGAAPTSGNGIQLRPEHAFAGRLIWAMDTSAYGSDELLLSDDHGASYNRSYTLTKDPASMINEFQNVQLGNGSVLAVMRNKQPGHRQAVAVSHDGGKTFGPIRLHSDLITPTCQGSVVFVKGNTILYAGPRSSTSRVAMTVLASDDNGEHFNRSLLIWPETSMYSSMQLLPSGQVVLLFERDGGNTSIVRFDVSSLK